jgi:hypothetical protein
MPTTKSAAELLNRLLYRALIEIRDQGREGGSKAVFHLADLFHTIPLQLDRVLEGQATYEEVLQALEAKAAEKGMERWLHAAVSEIESAQQSLRTG